MSYDDFRRVDRHDPSTRRIASAQHYSPVLIVLTVLATAGILVYAVFLLNPANRGDLLPWLMVISAETVLVVHALLAMWTVLSGTRDPRDYRYFTAQSLLFDAREAAGRGVRHQAHRWPLRLNGERVTVEVFVTAYGEPIKTVRRTLRAALDLRGEHRTWLLDDGRSDEMRALAEEMGCRYLRRLNNHGAKAGNVNHALTIAKGDYFCIFDADFVPHAGLPGAHAAVLRRRDGRVRPDAADLRQPAQHDLPRRGLHADGLLQVRPARPEPLQRGVLRRHQRGVPAGRGARDRRHPRRLQVRGRVDLVAPPRARLAQHLPGQDAWPSGTRPTPSRRTPSSSCAGRPAASRS